MGAVTKRRHHKRQEEGKRKKKKSAFGRENAKLRNTAVKEKDGCSMTGCMTGCNYASSFT